MKPKVKKESTFLLYEWDKAKCNCLADVRLLIKDQRYLRRGDQWDGYKDFKVLLSVHSDVSAAACLFRTKAYTLCISFYQIY